MFCRNQAYSQQFYWKKLQQNVFSIKILRNLPESSFCRKYAIDARYFAKTFEDK